jgi:hypothetical protein
MGDVDEHRRPTLPPLYSRDWHKQELNALGEASSSSSAATSDNSQAVSRDLLLVLDCFLCFLTWCKVYTLHRVHSMKAARARRYQAAKLRLVSLSTIRNSPSQPDPLVLSSPSLTFLTVHPSLHAALDTHAIIIHPIVSHLILLKKMISEANVDWDERCRSKGLGEKRRLNVS